MDEAEADKIGEALCRWLDGQRVSPSDGTEAMSYAIGAMLASKAKGLFELAEGLAIVTQLIQVTAIECMSNQDKLRI